ncbi:TPA: hypothetical protein UM358_000787 [Stenotrophomonas maltophilia]|uniref:hypothetical protein n=1 Tax=Gammaproteobacteria TaxID=1236 RepID=UPI000E32D08D|nr:MULTISPECIES: hypothetical protein [Gammaproteobacteria]MCR1805911.1 hypothetical protein [Stenotrophomonas geniculata]HEL3006461.1 hypothetical protein [Stenotrophomonas maltophilia]HEL4204340.1 hypothetical protein [Stenotrophomonas maltophilia]
MSTFKMLAMALLVLSTLPCSVFAGTVIETKPSSGSAAPEKTFMTVPGVGRLPYLQLFEEHSAPGEDLDAFVVRVAPRLREYSRETGFEACGVLASDGARFAVIVGTNQAHTLCVNDATKVPAGLTHSGHTLHSHPVGEYRVNAQDRLVLGALTPLNSRQKRGPAGFSAEDIASGHGYVVERDRVLHQAGQNAVREVR